MKIINEIYDILSDHETEGLDLYDRQTYDAILEFFHSQYPNIEFVIDGVSTPDETIIIYALAWVEEGHPQFVMFECR